MTTVKDLRLRAHWSRAQLARAAGVDQQTVKRAEDGEPIFDYKAYQIIEALARELNEKISLEDVSGLNLQS